MNDQDSRRRSPYTWVTWITGLLSGRHRCKWAAWYKSHYHFAKLPTDNERLNMYNQRHDKMVEERAQQMMEDGYVVSLERYNTFTLEGNNITLSGQPDIVGLKDGTALVVDAKGGEVRESDKWQVWTYMYGLPLKWKKQRLEFAIKGEVQYLAGSLPVPTPRPEDTGQIKTLMVELGRTQAPERVPSEYECRFCNIAACPDRISIQDEPVQVDDW